MFSPRNSIGMVIPQNFRVVIELTAYPDDESDLLVQMKFYWATHVEVYRWAYAG
jgi:hypothetical protein